MGWKETRAHFSEQFFHSLDILITIFFHASLFVLWVVLDQGAGHLVRSLGEHGLHEQIAHAFRFIASAGIFCLAVTPAISDIIEVTGVIRKKIFVSWNLVCKTCPAKQSGEETTE